MKSWIIERNPKEFNELLKPQLNGYSYNKFFGWTRRIIFDFGGKMSLNGIKLDLGSLSSRDWTECTSGSLLLQGRQDGLLSLILKIL